MRLRWIMSCLVIFALFAEAPAQQRQLLQPWWRRAPENTSRHYWIKTDLPRAEARELADHLDRMYDQYARRLASLPPRVPQQLNVLIFKDRRDYERTLRARYGVNADGTGGMFFVQPTGSALAFWTGGLSRRRVHHVLQHEGFHQFAWSRFGDELPVWVNEGLAEFFGESILVDRKLVLGQSSPRAIDRVQKAIELESFIRFRRMLTMDSATWSDALRNDSAALQYAQAWSMVHFLVYGDNGRYVKAFERYLQLINNGQPSEAAFISAFETNAFDAFEERWRLYAANLNPSAFATAYERIEFMAEGLMSLSYNKVYPESIEALRLALKGVDFRLNLSRHGLDDEMSAADESNFRMALGGLSDEPPAFVLQPAKPRVRTLRDRKLEETNPTPPAIVTVNLQPKNLRIEWVRDRKTNTFSYEIVVE